MHGQIDKDDNNILNMQFFGYNREESCIEFFNKNIAILANILETEILTDQTKLKTS